MDISSKWPRRSFMTAVVSFAGVMLKPRALWARPSGRSSPPAAPAISGFGHTGNVYEELGVTTVVNGQGTMTVLGGSLMARGRSGDGFSWTALCERSRSRSCRGQAHHRNAKASGRLLRLVTSGAAAAMQSGPLEFLPATIRSSSNNFQISLA